MNPIQLDQPLPNTSGIHPALRSFADECSAVAVRILAYLSGLAILTVIAVDLVSAVPVAANTGLPALPIQSGWVPASRPHPAFAISKLDLSDRTDAYEIIRHPEGGRKDILRWAATAGEAPTAEIEIYRPAENWTPLPPPRSIWPPGWMVRPCVTPNPQASSTPNSAGSP